MKELNKNSELELNQDISKLIGSINNLENEYKIMLKKYSDEFSVADKKQQDILHYIEFNNINSVAGYRLIKELQAVRQERRRAEDNVELLNAIALNLTLNNKDKTVNATINNRKQKVKNRKYHMKIYKDGELTFIANTPLYKGNIEANPSKEPEEIFNFSTMNINAKKGSKVIFKNPNSGYEYDIEKAKKYLELNKVYTVEKTIIGGSYTSVVLQEFPNEAFNSIQFVDWEGNND